MKEGVLEIFYLAPKIQRIRAMKETSIQEGSDSSLKSLTLSCEMSLSHMITIPQF